MNGTLISPKRFDTKQMWLVEFEKCFYFSSTRRHESFLFFTNHSPSAKITHDAKYSKEKTKGFLIIHVVIRKIVSYIIDEKK